MKVIFVLILFLGTLFTLPAYSKSIPMRFGMNDNIHKIQDVQLKDPKGNDLYLGYRTTIVFFIAGIYLKDQGYVLGIKGNKNDQCYPLTQEGIQILQSQTILPTPLPKYNIGFINYLFGYSLWVIIGSALLYVALQTYFEQRRMKAKVKTTATIIANAEMREYFLKNFPPDRKSLEKKR